MDDGHVTSTSDFPGEFVSSLTAGTSGQVLVALSHGTAGRLLAINAEGTVWTADLPYNPVHEPATLPGEGAVIQLRDPDYDCALTRQ